MIADRSTDDEAARILDRLANLLATGNFADPGTSRIVGEDNNIAREERPVRPAQVQQHAVATGDGNDLKLGDSWCGHGRAPRGLLMDQDCERRVRRVELRL